MFLVHVSHGVGLQHASVLVIILHGVVLDAGILRYTLFVIVC